MLCPIGIRKSNIDGETFCQSFPRIFFFWISSSELLKERSFRYLEIFDTNFSVLIWRKSCSLLLISFCALVAFLYPLIFVYCIIRVQAPLNTNIFRGIDGEDAVRQFRAPPPRSTGVITPLDCFPFFFFFFWETKKKGRKKKFNPSLFFSFNFCENFKHSFRNSEKEGNNENSRTGICDQIQRLLIRIWIVAAIESGGDILRDHRYDLAIVNSGDSPRDFKASRNLRVTTELWPGIPWIPRLSFNRYATLSFHACISRTSKYGINMWWGYVVEESNIIARIVP